MRALAPECCRFQPAAHRRHDQQSRSPSRARVHRYATHNERRQLHGQYKRERADFLAEFQAAQAGASSVTQTALSAATRTFAVATPPRTPLTDEPHANSGGLGDGTMTDRLSPVQVVSSGVAQVAGGRFHSHFIKTDGTLWGMGLNDEGQLGIGTNSSHFSPKLVLASGVSQVAAGRDHSLWLVT